MNVYIIYILLVSTDSHASETSRPHSVAPPTYPTCALRDPELVQNNLGFLVPTHQNLTFGLYSDVRVKVRSKFRLSRWRVVVGFPNQ